MDGLSAAWYWDVQNLGGRLARSLEAVHRAISLAHITGIAELVNSCHPGVRVRVSCNEGTGTRSTAYTLQLEEEYFEKGTVSHDVVYWPNSDDILFVNPADIALTYRMGLRALRQKAAKVGWR